MTTHRLPITEAVFSFKIATGAIPNGFFADYDHNMADVIPAEEEDDEAYYEFNWSGGKIGEAGIPMKFADYLMLIAKLAPHVRSRFHEGMQIQMRHEIPPAVKGEYEHTVARVYWSLRDCEKTFNNFIIDDKTITEVATTKEHIMKEIADMTNLSALSDALGMLRARR